MTRGDLIARTDSRELSEWMAFYILEGKEQKRAMKGRG
jgi:hypothetical protein